MSKRYREEATVEFRSQVSKSDPKNSSAQVSTSGESKMIVVSRQTSKDGLKIHNLSPDRFSEIVSRMITMFKTINNAVTSLQSRRKQCSWDLLVESYQSIASDALVLDDLLTIISVWPEAFHLRWHVKSFDANHNPRAYELVVEIPPRVASNVAGGSNNLQSSLSSLKEAPIVESVSKSHIQRIGNFTDRVYALVDKALATKSLVLDMHADVSFLPAKPDVAVHEPVVKPEQSVKTFLAREKDVMAQDDAIEATTYEILTARAIERGKQADVKAELLKSAIHVEESNKLLAMLPAMADALRSLSRRLNRTRMPKKDCVDSVASSMHIKYREAVAGIDQLASIVPEFLAIEPSQEGMPSVVHINTNLKYNEVRGFIVQYVKEASS